MNFKFIPAQLEDLAKIVEIYNWAVLNTTATFDTETKTVESRINWFHDHTPDFPLYVIKNENNEVCAWGSLTKWSERKAYDICAEVSFYVDPKAHGKGLGTYILAELIKLGQRTNKKNLISRITSESSVSLHLHHKLGFQEIGIMKQCGIKFNRVLDVNLLQYLY